MNKRYKIKGIHCEACAKLIKIELDEAGFKEAIVDEAKEELDIPEDYINYLPHIRAAIKKAGDYDVLAEQSV